MDWLIPGRFPAPGNAELLLAVDLGRVAGPASGNAKLPLAVDLGRVAEPVPGMLNSYYLSRIQFQSSKMRNYHWSKTQAASPDADEAVTSGEACERRLVAAYFLDFLKVQGRSGHHGIEWEEERGQGPSSDTFPKVAGSQ